MLILVCVRRFDGMRLCFCIVDSNASRELFHVEFKIRDCDGETSTAETSNGQPHHASARLAIKKDLRLKVLRCTDKRLNKCKVPG